MDFDAKPTQDPFVRRLIEAFAFLTARVQMKIDDDFPDTAAAMLEKILPLSTKAFPAFTIIQMHPGDQLPPGGKVLPRTETRIRLEDPAPGINEAFFQTCFDTSILALCIDDCFVKRDLEDAQHRLANSSAAAIFLSMSGSEQLPLSKVFGGGEDSSPSHLRFYLADDDIKFELAQLLFNQDSFLGIGFTDGTNSWEFPSSQLRVLGFSENEIVLPSPRGLPIEYQFLMELFAYPDKHLFFEIPIPGPLKHSNSKTFELYFYLKRSKSRIESLISSSSFRLNCCPIVNLSRENKNIAVSKYCIDTLIYSETNDSDLEIFDITSVHGLDDSGVPLPVKPIYGIESDGSIDEGELFYQTRKQVRPSGIGADVFLSLVDLTMQPSNDNKFREMSLELVCCNRCFFDLNKINRDANQFRIIGYGLVEKINRVSDWTRFLMPVDRSQKNWQLISLLNLNFLLTKEPNKAETLKRILQLLNRNEASPIARSWIDSISQISQSSIIDRIDKDPWPVVVDGTKLEILLDDSRDNNRPGSWLLFGFGLSYFFSLHTSVNSFTQLIIRASEDNQILAEFPKKCGTRTLL